MLCSSKHVFPANIVILDSSLSRSSQSVIQSSSQTKGGSSLTFILQWLRFVFLSACPQRALFSSIDTLFLLLLLAFSVHKLLSRKTNNSNSSIDKNLKSVHARATLWFYLSLIITSLLAICYTVLCVVAFTTKAAKSQWALVESLFYLVQSITHVAILVLVAQAKRFEARTHPLSLRIYWVGSCGLACLFSVSAIIRLSSVKPKRTNLDVRVDDVFSLAVNLPVSIVLLVIAVRGSTGISVTATMESGSEQSSMEEPLLINKPTSIEGYASASWFSKSVWLWMNPLLKIGYKSALKIEQVPSLATNHRAEQAIIKFESNLPKLGENSIHPVRITLLKCFYKDLLFTGFLAIVHLLIMYSGPILLQSFVNLASNKSNSPTQGFYLVLALLIAKTIEVLTSHHFNFSSQNVGMLIRSTLITALYKKGLRLSCTSRQQHGLGQIVNYMSVDAQQLSDLVFQLHNLWLMPFQVAISLILLYFYMGISSISALIATTAITISTLLTTTKINKYQFDLMTMKDSRMKSTTEMLNNIRVIKLQSWEPHFNERIEGARDMEFKCLTKFLTALSANMVLLWSTPVVVATLVFGTAVAVGYPLSAGTVFTATSLFKILQDPIRAFPQALISVSQAWVSMGRLDGFLGCGELGEGGVEREEGCGGDGDGVVLEVRDGVFGWGGESEEGVLREVNLVVRRGEVVAVVGTVGSGKSSLLGAVMGEMHKISGKVRVCGSTAYVAQTSWIQNGTIQENILFGSQMNVEKYREVIKACCLDPDLEMMEFGDQTEIGERGINLSGGQKQRIQLARAIYQDCDIYFLDDVFSAVDAHTGSELFKECIRGALKGKTILLVTHQIDFLHNADLILVMRDGKIVQSGKYNELLQSGMDFGALVAAHESAMELVENDSDEHVKSPRSVPKPNSPHAHEVNGGDKSLEQQKPEKKGSSKLIEDEERETGRVDWQVYKAYVTEAYGWWGVAAVLLISALWQFSLMAGDYWLSYETAKERVASFDSSFFIRVYTIISVVSCVFVLIRAFIVTFFGLKTAQIFFKQILQSILHAPMSFFDTTPSGRILSRASTDQTNVDLLLPFFMSLSVITLFTVIGVLIIICQVAWPTIFLIIPLGWLNLWYRGYYIASSRELTRLSSITKAPIIHHFSESVAGVMTIRCFRKQEIFIQVNINRVNANMRMDFYNNGSTEWLGFRLEFIGSVALCLSAFFMVLLPSNIVKPESVGLSLSYGLSLNGVLFWTVYISCLVENRMISVERIKQFINIPAEAAWHVKDHLPSSDWPSHGNVDLENLQVRYRPNTPLILKDITLSIHGGEKIGVVGRTGSGKSTLIQAFFRMMEPSGGRIVIDGVDISKLGLHDLRSRFGIIPQEPVLFQGTVRSNIDPIGLYSDEEIWKSLDHCQLKDVVAAKPDKLDCSVVDSGDNWSVGQRQLLCLGRVMLKRSRILFMDEATASVDSQTDGVIQRIIREDFAACTIISIAHRIPTVTDCDRVLVVDAGCAKEFDKPSRLLEWRSLFAALVQEYANRSSEF